MGEMQNKPAHTVTLNQRKHVMITGVNDVCSFHENEIVLKVDTGIMVITGEGLHVGKLVLEEGRLDVEGRVDGMHYEQPHSVSRLLRFGKRS